MWAGGATESAPPRGSLGELVILKVVDAEGLNEPCREGAMGDQVTLVTAVRKPMEISHLLIEAIACGQRDSIIHATIGKLRCCPLDMMQHFRI